MSRTPYNPSRNSFWLRDLFEKDASIFFPSRELENDIEVDVCIVGAGYTGLWTAYELRRAAPHLAIAVLDAKYPGYGASGRNGGAVIPRINGSRAYWAKIGGSDGVRFLEKALQETIDEVGRVIAHEKIDCSFTKAGMLEIARTPLELERMKQAIQDDWAWGHKPSEVLLLNGKQASDRIAAHGLVGAIYRSQAASLHPGALVLGLARVVTDLGVKIYHNSPVISIEPRVARTSKAIAKAKFIVSATEAYTQSIATERNRIVPVHTSMLVTETLSSEQLRSINWDKREVLLAEHPFLHLQRTAGNKITIGGDDNRITYRYGSRPCPDGVTVPKVHDMYRRELIRLFPALADVRIEQSWQGIFGAPRNWSPSVGLDEKTGIAWAGGYVGEGLAASNLAARTLRDLLLGEKTALTRLSWVRPRARRWEPEPLRILGATAILSMRHCGEYLERKTGRSSPLVQWGNRLAGFTGFLG